MLALRHLEDEHLGGASNVDAQLPVKELDRRANIWQGEWVIGMSQPLQHLLGRIGVLLFLLLLSLLLGLLLLFKKTRHLKVRVAPV